MASSSWPFGTSLSFLVCSFLDYKSVANLSQTSKHLQKFADDDIVWLFFSRKEFPLLTVLDGSSCKHNFSYAHQYEKVKPEDKKNYSSPKVKRAINIGNGELKTYIAGVMGSLGVEVKDADKDKRVMRDSLSKCPLHFMEYTSGIFGLHGTLFNITALSLPPKPLRDEEGNLMRPGLASQASILLVMLNPSDPQWPSKLSVALEVAESCPLVPLFIAAGIRRRTQGTPADPSFLSQLYSDPSLRGFLKRCILHPDSHISPSSSAPAEPYPGATRVSEDVWQEPRRVKVLAWDSIGEREMNQIFMSIIELSGEFAPLRLAMYELFQQAEAEEKARRIEETRRATVSVVEQAATANNSSVLSKFKGC